MANVTIPAPNPMNIPATRLSNKNPHHIPKSSPAGMNNAALLSWDFFSLCFVTMENNTK